MTSSRSWKRASADEHVRDAPRLERADVRAGDVVAEALEALEEEADVARLDGDVGSADSRSVIVQPLLRDEPVDERADRVGERLARSATSAIFP